MKYASPLRVGERNKTYHQTLLPHACEGSGWRDYYVAGSGDHMYYVSFPATALGGETYFTYIANGALLKMT